MPKGEIKINLPNIIDILRCNKCGKSSKLNECIIKTHPVGEKDYVQFGPDKKDRLVIPNHLKDVKFIDVKYCIHCNSIMQYRWG